MRFANGSDVGERERGVKADSRDLGLSSGRKKLPFTGTRQTMGEAHLSRRSIF